MDFWRIKLGVLWGRACLLFKNREKIEGNLQCFDSKRALDGAFFREKSWCLGLFMLDKCWISARNRRF